MNSPKQPRKESEQFPDLPKKIRPELNIEKWSIWQPANARTGLRERVFERIIEAADGSRISAKLTVAPNIKGNLTTEDQRVYYALVKLWEERGRSESFTWFSLRRLAAVLGRSWASQTRDSLRKSLMRLRMTGFIWEKAFEDGSRKNRLGVLRPFTILDDLKIVEREHDGHVTKEAGYFRFHDSVLKNLLANYTKPVFFDVVLSFRSEIAQLLYTHLDLILSDKTSYERRTRELFEDLGLEGKDYHKPSVRRRRLEPALKELEGKPVTTGIIVKAALESTKDGDDFKLVVKKGRASKAIASLPEPSNVVPFPTVEPKDERSSEAEDLVRHFHRVFHGTPECHPSGRAIDQAAGLLARCGMQKARHIIAFAQREAAKTRFKVATFGAVLQYEARAIKDFEDQEHVKRRQLEQRHAEQAKQEEEAAQERAQDAAFQSFFESLSDEERKTLEAEAIEHAPSYGLGFLLRRYQQQGDQEGLTAKAYLRTLLKTHFEARQAGSS
jgi:hypothetical protein